MLLLLTELLLTGGYWLMITGK